MDVVCNGCSVYDLPVWSDRRDLAAIPVKLEHRIRRDNSRAYGAINLENREAQVCGRKARVIRDIYHPLPTQFQS